LKETQKIVKWENIFTYYEKHKISRNRNIKNKNHILLLPTEKGTTTTTTTEQEKTFKEEKRNKKGGKLASPMVKL
jgi:hypothetical protein